ncbi:unnamed protein product [Darwinula stevensoni]|uniref:Uncharacterized protein n=1 Tax=Darwinula stevensoni TaxID=69355 RepID=A0A7R9A3M4_9CRUS|nr:unnamed protein product [Darwinula stevensoni]CAG0890899.1 unnamed protein product [Darwinula stevensoni]
MSSEEKELTLVGGSPWGFRFQGGADTPVPLRVTKLIFRDRAQCPNPIRLSSLEVLAAWLVQVSPSCDWSPVERRHRRDALSLVLVRWPHPLLARARAYVAVPCSLLIFRHRVGTV